MKENWDPSDWYPMSGDTAIVDQGTVRFSSTPAYCLYLQLGSAPSATGRMLVESGANLRVGQEGGTMDLGGTGVGILTQTGGTLRVGSDAEENVSVHLGETAAGRGYLELSGTDSYLACTDWVHVGHRGQGTFTQTGGSAYLESCVSAGNENGSYGLILLSGGTLDVAMDHVAVGRLSGSRGSLALSGQGVIHGAYLDVGWFGEGTLTQTGGSIGPGINMCIGSFVGGDGAYHMSAGLVDAASFVVGDYGAAQMTISGGSVLASGAFGIGRSGTGTVIQSGGYVGSNSAGVGGGGAGTGGTGVYTLNAGHLDTGSLGVGYEDSLAMGTFHLEGGFVQSSMITLGPGLGVFVYSGGSLAADWITVAGQENCRFNQSTGHLVGYRLTLGDYEKNGRGLYVLDNYSHATFDNLNMKGGGTFFQDEDTLAEFGTGYLGVGDSGPDYYVLHSAEATFTDLVLGHGDDENELDPGEGFFLHDGGSVAVYGSLCMGDHSEARGTYLLTGGEATFAGGTVGSLGIGYFKQTAGVVYVRAGTVPTTLLLGELSTGNGTYELNNASLLAGTISAGQGQAVFLLSGGSYTPPAMTFGPNLVNSGGVLTPVHWTIAPYNYLERNYVQYSGGTLGIELHLFHPSGSGGSFRQLRVGQGASLDGLLHVSNTYSRPRECTTFPVIISESGISGDFATITTDLTLGPDPSHPAFFERVADTGGTYLLRMRGLTEGDANGDHSVDGGDLAILGGNWWKYDESFTWSDADFNADHYVNGGDLALMGSNWWWSCPNPELHSGGDGKSGGGEGKFDDGGLDLSDRDGDGDFDVDDMLIIIKEMNDPSKKAPAARDSSANGIPDDVLFETGPDDEILDEAALTDVYPDGGEDANSPALDGIAPGGLPPEMLPPPPPDPSASSDLPPAAPLDNPTDTVALAAAMDLPIFWSACWVGSVGVLFCPRRQAG